MHIKVEMAIKSGDTSSPSNFKHQHLEPSSNDQCKDFKWQDGNRKGQESSWSDMSLLSDFSDMSSSDPEEMFLPDLSSSLESLHNIEAFNFFNEKQNLAF